MLFKGSNNLVQIYRSFSITGNYGRGSFSKLWYFLLHADVNIHASNRQIWYRHPNSEAGNDEIQNVQIKVITKLPNSEQSYKGKVKTHNYIYRQNQSTTGKL